MRNPRSVRVWLILLAALTLAGCSPLGSEPVPETSNYDLALDHLRMLATSLPGERPSEIRRALVCEAEMPGAFMMAGRSWDGVPMSHVVFQVLRPNGSFVVIDSAQDRATHEAVPMGVGAYHDEAWNDVVRALETAEQVVITHEHPDHIGGAAAHPRPEALVSRLRLGPEQLANAEALEMVGFPAALAEGLEPLAFDARGAVALAPGIVVKRAAGHTPGNQIVFVQMADGQELLFVGDVVWNRDAITDLVYRPRFVTNWIIGEDREAGLNQLRAMRDLYDSDEGVHIVVSHDDRTHAHPSIREDLVLPWSGRRVSSVADRETTGDRPK